MNGTIDLRSDTITQPTREMRKAMAEALVGDDVFEDDPTVHALEERTASILGKEAAMFVPSGTMGNQIAVRVHTQHGDQILLDANAHIYHYEAGAIAALAGVLPCCLPGQRGVFTAEDVESNLRTANVHFAPSRLLCVENTHNRGGGSVWPLDRIRDVAATAGRHGLKLHLDGARLWNASVKTGIPESEFASCFDTVSVCFSKGLGAPVGSALAGDRETIRFARRIRKQFGGGMRQAGVLAAAALHALEHHRERLKDDHDNARRLVDGLAGLKSPHLMLEEVETNIVFFQTPHFEAQQLVAALETQGVRMIAVAPKRVRAVTSLMVDAAGVDRAVERVGEWLTGNQAEIRQVMERG